MIVSLLLISFSNDSTDSNDSIDPNDFIDSNNFIVSNNFIDSIRSISSIGSTKHIVLICSNGTIGYFVSEGYFDFIVSIGSFCSIELSSGNLKHSWAQGTIKMIFIFGISLLQETLCSKNR